MLSKNDYAYGESAEIKEIELGRIIAELFDHRLYVIFITLCFATIGVLVALFSTPIYVADALVQIEDKQQNSLLKSLNQLTPGLTPDASAEIQLLKSRMILGKTIHDLGLRYQVTRVRFPLLGEGWARLTRETPAVLTLGLLEFTGEQTGERALTLTALGEGRFRIEGEGLSADGMAGQMLQTPGLTLRVNTLDAAAGTRFTIALLSLPHAINDLNTRFSVKEVGKESGMLSLGLTGTDPQKIAATLKSITDNYLRQNIARQAAHDSQSLAFLQRQLPGVRAHLEEAEKRLNSYRRQRDSVDLNLEAKSVLEQLVNVDNQLNELTFREAEIAQHFKKDHPNYRALSEKRHTLEDERGRLNRRVSAMPTIQQEILRLSREVDSGRAIYQQLMTRQQELNISRSSTIGNVRIIDEALTSPDPVKPRKLLTVALATLMGLMFAAVSVMAKAVLRKGIDSPDRLEAQGMNVYATLPRSAWLWQKTRFSRMPFFCATEKHQTTNVPFLPVDRPLDIFVEAVRGLRTSLHFAMMDADNNILMFSGPAQNCGKTLVSTTLAALVAQVGERVLLVDADMRKGYVHNIFELSNEAGLSDVLSGRVAFQQAVQTYAASGIDVVTCGQVPPNPSELLMHDRFKKFMQWASEQYDMVIVDTPPILAVTDAALVGSIAASTLLVARYNVTSVKQMLVCTRRLQTMNVNVKGVVLNDVVKSAVNGYASGYSLHEDAVMENAGSRGRGR